MSSTPTPTPINSLKYFENSLSNFYHILTITAIVAVAVGIIIFFILRNRRETT
jgi:hypothetical protein